MKKIYLTLLTIILLSALKVNAQTGLSEVIKSTPADATKLFDAYAEPIFKGFGIGMNSGWNTTAKTKGLFNFDIRISATAAFVPSSAQSFDLTKIGLSSNTRPTDPTQTITPTIGGARSQGPSVSVFDNNGNKLTTFVMPGGSSSVFGAPQVQATIGLPFNTDIMLRGMPSVNFGDNLGRVSMIGIGFKHNLIHDIFGKATTVVPFDFAISGGFTHTTYSLPLNVQPYNGATPVNNQQATDFTNQHFGGLFNSYMIQAIVSKKLAVFTPFISVYYASSNTYMILQGNYPLTTGINNTYTTYTNPININEKSIANMQADAGFQVSLGFFKVFASYIFAQYKSVNAGIGFGL